MINIKYILFLALIGLLSVSASLSSPSKPLRFNTRAFSNLSPVTHYELIHEDQEHSDGLRPMVRGEGLKSHVVYPFASTKLRSFNGLSQHFPNSLRLVVHALEQVHDLELHLLTHLKEPNAVINGNWGSMPALMNTYQTLDHPASIVTFRPDGSFEAMIRYRNSSAVSQGGWEWESVQISHIEQHAGETLSSFDYQAMALAAPHGMVAHKLSEANGDYFSKMKCGTNHNDYHPQHNHFHESAYNNPSIGICNGIPCRFPDDGTAGTPCWPNIAQLSSMSTGILCDYGYTQIFAASTQSQTITNTALAVDQTMALVNSIYVPTFNIFNRVGETKVMTARYNSATDASTLSWNRGPQDTTNTGAPATNAQNCQTDSINGGWTINNALTAVINYNAADKDPTTQVARFGLRHLFTNCFPLLASTGSGTVGLASLAALAQTDGQSSGVSTYTGSHWVTIAHEMGHNYGAPHTFGNDGTDPNSGITGKVGGIMDYNDPANPPGVYPLPSVNANGIVQFHPQLSKPPMCQQITTTYNGLGNGFVANVLQPFTPTCGNGVIEPGEACDDTTGCCGSNCQLIPNAQCTPNALSPCCDNTCLFRPTSYGCKGSSTYCSNGKCVPNGCTAFSNTANCPISTGGISGGDGCNFYCDFNSGSGCTNGQGGSLSVTDFGTVPDGVVCSTSATNPSFGYGLCSGNPTGSKTGAQSVCTKTTAPPAPNPGSGQTTTPTTASSAATTAAGATTNKVATTSAATTRAVPTTAAPTTAAPACVSDTTCVSCVDDPMYYCGWCPSTQTCVSTDQNGVAGSGACPVAVYFDSSAQANNGAAVCSPAPTTAATPTTAKPTTATPTTARPTSATATTVTPTTRPGASVSPTTAAATTTPGPCYVDATCNACVGDAVYYCGWCALTGQCLPTSPTGDVNNGAFCPQKVLFDAAATPTTNSVCSTPVIQPTTFNPIGTNTATPTTALVSPTVPGDVNLWIFFTNVPLPTTAWQTSIITALNALFTFNKGSSGLIYLVEWSTYSSISKPNSPILQAVPRGTTANVWVQVGISAKGVASDGAYSLKQVSAQILTSGNTAGSPLRGTLTGLTMVTTVDPKTLSGNQPANNDNGSSSSVSTTTIIIAVVVIAVVVIAIVSIACLCCRRSADKSATNMSYMANHPGGAGRNTELSNFQSNPAAYGRY